MLETDQKSLQSISSEGQAGLSSTSSNGSASPTSISVHSATLGTNETENGGSAVPEYSDKTWNLWGKIVNEWDEYRKKNGKQLKVVFCYYIA